MRLLIRRWWRYIGAVQIYFFAMLLVAYLYGEYGAENPYMKMVITLYFIVTGSLLLFGLIDISASSVEKKQEKNIEAESDASIEISLDKDSQKILLQYCCENNLTLGEALQEVTHYIIENNKDKNLKKESIK